MESKVWDVISNVQGIPAAYFSWQKGIKAKSVVWMFLVLKEKIISCGYWVDYWYFKEIIKTAYSNFQTMSGVAKG